ncbi:MAG: hypothetical protein IH600_00520 [Bacteroidetes bacterium]|nr:hypothetical protein [Bacteroidota bacterium]
MFDTSHLHPMIVHFPIALVMVGLLFEVIGIATGKDAYSKGGLLLLLLGTAGAVAAYFSGDLAGDGVTEAGALGAALETHEAAAILALWLLVATTVVRTGLVIFKRYSGWVRMLPLALYLVATAAVVRTGYYGGDLVYKHAAGVQLDLGFGSGTVTVPSDAD